jgi:hypothetical protein
VLAKLEDLLDNRFGEQMKPKALKAARKEARRRVAGRIPPGYEDAGKADPTGDYLIFRQLMDEAKTGQRPVVFATDDEKPDWYWRVGPGAADRLAWPGTREVPDRSLFDIRRRRYY